MDSKLACIFPSTLGEFGEEDFPKAQSITPRKRIEPGCLWICWIIDMVMKN